MYFKCNGTKWSSIVDKCREKDIDMVEIIFHTKYPVNVPRWFGFSVITVDNVQAALVLDGFECEKVIISYFKPDIFTDDEWDYLLPYMEENDLLNKEINMFYRDYKDPYIIQVVTDTLKTWFYSDYYVKLLYKISDHTYKPPSEIEDLFIDDGACLNAIYISDYLNK